MRFNKTLFCISTVLSSNYLYCMEEKCVNNSFTMQDNQEDDIDNKKFQYLEDIINCNDEENTRVATNENNTNTELKSNNITNEFLQQESSSQQHKQDNPSILFSNVQDKSVIPNNTNVSINNQNISNIENNKNITNNYIINNDINVNKNSHNNKFDKSYSLKLNNKNKNSHNNIIDESYSLKNFLYLLVRMNIHQQNIR